MGRPLCQLNYASLHDYVVGIQSAQTPASPRRSGCQRHKVPVSAPDLTLRPVWFGSVGADYKITSRWTAALWLDMQQATTATSGREAEVTADLTYRIAPAWKIDVYGVKGFAAGSPAVGGGIILTWQHKF